jgi:transposase
MASEMELFQLALGLEKPWQVVNVEFSSEPGELHMHLDAARGGALACPECGTPSSVYDRLAPRQWRHLNFFQYKAFIHARVPRVQCPQCGVKTVAVPWARPGCGFTLLFEAFVLTLAKQMPVATVADILGESDTRLWRVLEHYVASARADVDMSEVKRVGVDETASRRGHKYVTVVADLEAAKVLFVTPGKDAGTLGDFKADLEAHQGQASQIEVVCSDLSPAFISGVGQKFPQALQVFDRFHVMKLLNEAVDQVRRLEVKENEVLKETRYIWLKNPQNLTDRQQAKLDTLRQMNLATATAYQMKLNLQELWTLPDRESAAVFLDRWYEWVMESDIARVMKKAAQTIKAHATGILNYFVAPVTNGLLEGINSLIQASKAKARGFRSTRYLEIVIYLIAGKLDFRLPLTHTK